MEANKRSILLTLEDWWAVWLGSIVLLLAVTGWIDLVPKVGKWSASPMECLGGFKIPSLLILGIGLTIITAISVRVMNRKLGSYIPACMTVFLIAIVAGIIAGQTAIAAKGLGYALWALVIGLLISNTIGTPTWLKQGAKSELFIKTGLVLLGAEILFNNILKLGGPGLFVAWLVTPIVIIVMFWYGTKWLNMHSKTLVMVISAATSVCGVSAAIATAGACRAKKEELTLAVGLSLIFTVLMMIGMPMFIKAIGIDPIVGAAWIGGTVDATGAVVAAGSMLGPDAEQVAAVVKMIQNVLIGVVAFFVAVYWVTRVETENSQVKPDAMEIWRRFPKFIVGFIGASFVFSFLLSPVMGAEAVESVLSRSETVRDWLFCMAFVSIGLESNYNDLKSQMSGGKPMILYIVGQSFNLIITLLAAYLAFGGILFDRPI